MLQFKNLKEVIKTFADEQTCIDFLVQQRWNGSPICPYCGSNKWYSIENRKRFKCGNKECYKKYSVTVGTCFHASNIPLTTWFPAMYLILSHKKGISSCQLSRDLGISQKTAWFMLHRIRESLKRKNSSLLQNTVEVDEIYIGGRSKNLSNKKRRKLQENKSGNWDNKIMVLGMLERGGNLKLEVCGNPYDKNVIPSVMAENIGKNAFLMTDGDVTYPVASVNYAGHESVNHRAHEYVREQVIHTNTIEGAFGLFRRCIIGTYHKLSPKHLHRYCDEMEYRYNSRSLKDRDRFETSLGRIDTRLSWKELTKDNLLTAAAIIEPEIPAIKNIQGTKREVYQILNGKIIAKYPSLIEAAKATGVPVGAISHTVRGKQKTARGFQWKYV